MRRHVLNLGQRVVLLIGFGIGLFFLGSWITTRREAATGWVAYAPLSNASYTPKLLRPALASWLQLLVWIALIIAWVILGLVLLRSRSTSDPSEVAP